MSALRKVFFVALAIGVIVPLAAGATAVVAGVVMIKAILIGPG